MPGDLFALFRIIIILDPCVQYEIAVWEAPASRHFDIMPQRILYLHIVIFIIYHHDRNSMVNDKSDLFISENNARNRIA